MSFDKRYPNRKDQRAQYRGVKRFDRGCRVRGGCRICESGRQHFDTKARTSADAELEAYEQAQNTEAENKANS